MTNVWKNPFVGIGMNDWERPYWLTASVDNFWLLTTMRYGIPAFLLLGIAYLLLLSAVIRRKLGSSGPLFQFRQAWAFTQVGLIVALCTVDIWAIALSYIFFLFGSGGWLAVYQMHEPAGAERGNAIAGPVSSAKLGHTRFGDQKVRQRPSGPAQG
jgi:hypothetical protein